MGSSPITAIDNLTCPRNGLICNSLGVITMPTNGLSLVGFLDQQPAMNLFRNSCVPVANATDQQLITDWQMARASIGAPIANAGIPDIQPIPTSHKNYIQQI